MTIRGLVGEAPTKNQEMLNWIEEAVELFQPESVVFCDGSEEEWNELAEQLVEHGTLIKLDEEAQPNSFLARSNPSDVARVESRTFICSKTEEDAGPTNNWMDPEQMRAEMREHFSGSMKGRRMYIVPFCMGPITDPSPKLGIEITDSPYVVMSMRIMTRMGKEALDKIGENGEFVKGLHSVGAPLEPGQEDSTWPCNDTKYITHFPEDREIWSYGSGYGGNAILAKKCYALRIASAMARDEGWMAEHMLILKLISPEDKAYYICAAFPSACGKTNLAMIQPTIPGWRAEVVGDDIAWLHFGEDGRLYAVNPENGFFGVAPGTNYASNPMAMKSMEPGNTLYTNVALTDDNNVWWESKEGEPQHLIDWLGNEWTPDSGNKAAHPNSRYCVPIEQCPVAAPEFNDPKGVPVSAILFGGRRADTVPLVTQARDWNHATFIGATLASGQTAAAAEAAVGSLRHDPMAMLPFIGYNAGDYLQHWIDMGNKGGDKMPEVFLVNWFRRGEDGRFLWPGFGENSRVLKWIIDRIEGRVEADETVVGYTARYEDIYTDGLKETEEDIREALSVNPADWERDLADNEEWLKFLGPKVPSEVWDEFQGLKDRVEAAK
ncbi:phosphoenolpyruvate carboxykinase (GTP) [Corynebacterium jeikeium]|jgi:phosphoenolpyruvate carboxykinase (GTP)|uniref:Phosphoenolpyruvate carboxykinase [GTP] n=1 Tax=Corynebacterium jeikeium (strain K411) TaxID=306537 RepID=PCKG_CORJK|nr:phosphoenolpyruvate carboxykinase (GTP) [Corynebacterium jeikeium]Q4JY04.1 RecName: Full=Phosphoenolpyruvate carboxykinase [GTP]; Short=PEP carboxykinase; Short=PEPCK [Corynebacterium jeikeium K411]EEW16567.1 phosphoenolpyruvate carboxykinase (GTP) [Corynebacterium jeikeium ATCC 43734]OOD29869.1 phosphoenolpyruvate carboxykinase [Corynebacterium jeikeium]WCZ52700.1 Phosphoenolpyruvate carboxykinase [GTP] [Corynebacterium jeikeium]CAI36303.1 phosphoenolpyruvate carboxykinase [Corynebacterium